MAPFRGMVAIVIVPLIAAVGAHPHAATPSSGSQTVQLVEQVGGATEAVAAANGLVYLGAGPRLVVLDPGGGTAPSMVGRSEVLPGIVQDIAVAGDHVAVATASYPTVDPDDPASAVHLINISDPTALNSVASLKAASWPRKLAVSGRMLCLLGEGRNETGLLQVIDISRPQEPIEVGRLELSLTLDLAVDGDLAYVVGVTDEPWPVGTVQLTIITLDPAGPPAIVDSLDLGTGNGSRAPGTLTVAGGLAYVAAEADEHSLWIIGVSNPQTPRLLFAGDGGFEKEAAIIAGHHAYLAGRGYDGQGQLWTIDISEPDAPRLASSLAIDGGVGSVAVSRAHAFLGGPPGDHFGPSIPGTALRIVDVSDPEHPAEIAAVSMDDPGAVAAHGPLAYVADGRLIRAFDVSEPRAPKELASYPLPDVVNNLTATGGALYVSDSGGGVYVLRVFPSDPQQVYLPSLLQRGDFRSPK